MDRNKTIAALAESEEERLLLVRVCDKLERARDRDIPAASCFLSPRQQALLRQLLPDCGFFGGTEGAERCMAFVLPEYLTAEDFFEDGPIACLRGSFYEAEAVGHRDVLGALMGAGIRRDAVGDICIHGKTCDIFIQSELTRYLLDNLSSAGRHHMQLEQISLDRAEKLPQELKEIRATVSSLRLDSIIAAGFHLSRGAAVEAVAAGRAAVNSLTTLKPDRPVQALDEISVRGLGKLRVLEVGGNTRKGRIALVLGRFLG
ncbi:MAG: hypothetical protein IJ357_00450 [Oscillospiraceae bacterium]|nr:hypothetical protein [Oscillospiraceae bacterium]